MVHIKVVITVFHISHSIYIICTIYNTEGCGSGSSRIRVFWSDADLVFEIRSDMYQDTVSTSRFKIPLKLNLQRLFTKERIQHQNINYIDLYVIRKKVNIIKRNLDRNRFQEFSRGSDPVFKYPAGSVTLLNLHIHIVTLQTVECES